MYQNCCRKCGSVSLHTEAKGNNTGLYCDDCGAWQKWIGKDELRAFEYSMRRSPKGEDLNLPDNKITKRTINITVSFNLSELGVSQITPKEKVKEMVTQEMIELFGWDEGYEGVEVKVVDTP